jgi:hypothetical protein
MTIEQYGYCLTCAGAGLILGAAERVSPGAGKVIGAAALLIGIAIQVGVRVAA